MQRTLCVVGSALLIALIARPARADTILTYTGNPYTVAYFEATTSMSETATIDLAGPLGVSFAGYVTPSSFSVFDGINTITDQTAIRSRFWFETDANGNISGWDVRVYLFATVGNPQVQPRMEWCSSSAEECSEFANVADDTVYFVQGGALGYEGVNDHHPGTWNVPEPASLSLLLLTILLMPVFSIRGGLNGLKHCSRQGSR